MDIIPQEILIKIFSFLPGSDVARFVQLNGKFCEFTKNNRKYLDFPKITLNWYNFNNEEAFVLLHPVFACGTEHSPKMLDILRNSSFFTVKFLRPFLKIGDYIPESEFHALSKCVHKSDDEQFLRSLIEYILKRADIEMEFAEEGRQISIRHIQLLTEGVKNNRNVVQSISISMNFIRNQTEWFHLISAIGRQKLKTKDFPKIRIVLGKGPYSTLSNLTELNELASLYRSAYFVVHATTAAFHISELAQAWRNLNFPQLFFNIELCCERRDPRSKLNFNLEGFQIEQPFKVSYTFQTEFLCSVSSKNTPSIRLEDIRTGNVLLVEKTNQRMCTRPNWGDSDLYELNTYLVKVTVIRK